MTNQDYKNYLKWLRKKKKDDNDGGPAIHLTNNYKYGKKQRFHVSKTAPIIKKKRHHQYFPQFDPRHQGPEIN